MCFLYRQSISIVYESKFKYIYRYFIKIDRCFCGILQSLPLRKCGLKYGRTEKDQPRDRSLPLRKCGLKYSVYHRPHIRESSLPLRKCGLKLSGNTSAHSPPEVTSLAEVWIEIICINVCHYSTWSLPLRKCGLKYI